jgi:shikimate kinase
MPPAGLQKIVLVGPRAAGKTTLGRALAARLHWGFTDADEELGRRLGTTAAAWLARHGEAAFRAVEQQVVLDLLAAPGRAVLALGGGAVTIPEVRTRLREPGMTTVWLQAPAAVLVDRQARAPRPPLTDLPLAAEVEHLLEARRVAYEEVASIRLETFPANVDACCDRLLATISPLLPGP